MRYEEYIQSEEWQNKRLWALDRADNKCQICCNKINLEVHHNEYTRLGKEIPSDLIILCESCHKLFHDSLPPKIKQNEIPETETKPDHPLKRVLMQIKQAENHTLDDAYELSAKWNHAFSPKTIISNNEKHIRDLRIKALQLKVQIFIDQNAEFQKAASGEDLINLMRVAQGLTKQKIAYSRMNDADLLAEFVKEFPDINNYLSNLF